MPRQAFAGRAPQRPNHLSRRSRIARQFGDLAVSGNLAFRDFHNYTFNFLEHIYRDTMQSAAITIIINR